MELLTISALSMLTEVPTPTLRKWTNTGLVRCYRDSDGNRLFDGKVVEKVRELREQRRRKTD
ncbi:MAG: MerR family transcriptional regulator [Steroidobacteraceae bacterium]